MTSLKSLGFLAVLICVALSVAAAQGNELQKKFSDVAARVKQMDNPAEKRQLLNAALQQMINAVETAERVPYISARELDGLGSFKRNLEQKHAELNGMGGFEKVSDRDLDAFVDYSVQDLEQAGEWVYISTATAVLLIILLIVLLR